MGERRNTIGITYGLTVLAPVVAGHEAGLRESLDRLPRGSESPFARLTTVHTARLQILDHLVPQGPSQQPDVLRSSYLVFTAVFDGALAPFLDAILRLLGRDADAWWRHCVGYPGVSSPAAFRAWVRHNQVPTSLFAVAAPNATVAGVRTSLAVRERLLAFAIQAQGLDAPELQRRFRQTFGEVA